MNEFVAIVLLIIAGCLFGTWEVRRMDKKTEERNRKLTSEEFARKMGIDDE